MATIVTFTGSEQHSSYGARGIVYVVEPLKNPSEQVIYQSPVATLLDQEWLEVQNGKWVTSKYEVPDGTLLRLQSMATRKGMPYSGGSAYLLVNSYFAQVKAEGDGYKDRIGSVSGPLQELSFEELSHLGISIPAKYKHYYRNKVVVSSLKKEKPAEE